MSTDVTHDNSASIEDNNIQSDSQTASVKEDGRKEAFSTGGQGSRTKEQPEPETPFTPLCDNTYETGLLFVIAFEKALMQFRICLHNEVILWRIKIVVPTNDILECVLKKHILFVVASKTLKEGETKLED